MELRMRSAALGLAALVPLVLLGGPQTSDAAAGTGRLYLVQAVPGATYAVIIDGESGGPVKAGKVLGPYDLPAGEHDVSFDGPGDAMATTVVVRADSSTDLVLHLPADTGGDPVVDVYRSPQDPIGPGKARVLIAHTATVPPADVRVDGQTVFENIANGEFVVADLPAGTHAAAIVPAGQPGRPLLGPLDVALPAGTLTLVYAYGTPTDGSMSVISHQEHLAADGSVAPTRVETGSAGLVSGVRVVPFGPS
jgi:hypothetical protein